MATINFILQQPYKRSDNKDKQIAEKENKVIREEIKKRKANDKPIGSLLNPRETRIYLFLIIDRNHVLKVKTDETILPKHWDFKNKKVKQSYTGCVEFNVRLQNLKTDVNNTYRKLMNDNRDIKFSEISENIRVFIKNGHIPMDEAKGKDFFSVFEEFITIRGSEQSSNTIQTYNTLLTTLKEFKESNNTKITFDAIDMKFHDNFKNYLLKKENPKKDTPGLTNDTIGKYFSMLKCYMKWTLDRSYHNNLSFRHADFKATRKPKQDIVTLKEVELTKLYKLDLSNRKNLERVRDLFCFAAYTGQRWSDIISFNKKDIKGNSWNFESFKTKKMMKVPFTTKYCSPAKDILIKYNYDLPKISSQKFNKYIKDVGKLAEFDREVIIKRYSGKRLIEIKKPLHQHMASHMARRSCVTILLELGVPPTTVMKLTGHTDLKTIMKYENTSQDALIKALNRVGNINLPKMKIA